MSSTKDSHFSRFLMEKRQQIDPKSLGYSVVRRRTPGLRREEVAQRANISVTWYTWLEQGRGGIPSAAVLDRIARALMLTASETEYLFLTTLGRLPETDYTHTSTIEPQLQLILDALNPNPAIIRNLTWDVLAWNKAATIILTDYQQVPVDQRNILRLFFLHKPARRNNPGWQNTARLIVSAFRADIARLGENDRTRLLINELCQRSTDFSEFWHSHEVGNINDGIKQMNNPLAGEISFNYSSFAVSASPELSLIVYTPHTPSDNEKILDLIK
ncbi:helix-turn-helix transcriptional regulator [Gynuella sp.]|uniref:helix-turn-helix transcriptional regulator n=1 Tax=Gynuella sp. TaxID=2969146 RepID=UPI003D14F1BF